MVSCSGTRSAGLKHQNLGAPIIIASSGGMNFHAHLSHCCTTKPTTDTHVGHPFGYHCTTLTVAHSYFQTITMKTLHQSTPRNILGMDSTSSHTVIYYHFTAFELDGSTKYGTHHSWQITSPFSICRHHFDGSLNTLIRHTFWQPLGVAYTCLHFPST